VIVYSSRIGNSVNKAVYDELCSVFLFFEETILSMQNVGSFQLFSFESLQIFGVFVYILCSGI